MTYAEFVAKYNGRYLESNQDIYKNQCVDLVQQYQKEVLKTPVTRGNGIDFDRNFDPRYYTYYRNTISFVPRVGDIAVFGRLVGTYGHVDIVNSANKINFTSFSQNWPLKSPCHIISHNMYWGVKGFLRRK